MRKFTMLVSRWAIIFDFQRCFGYDHPWHDGCMTLAAEDLDWSEA